MEPLPRKFTYSANRLLVTLNLESRLIDSTAISCHKVFSILSLLKTLQYVCTNAYITCMDEYLYVLYFKPFNLN